MRFTVFSFIYLYTRVRSNACVNTLVDHLPPVELPANISDVFLSHIGN